MNLYFMRHCIAVDRDDPSVSADEERPLSRNGAKRLRRCGRGMRRLEIPFDGVLTSPVLRARQSAEIVVQSLGIEKRLTNFWPTPPKALKLWCAGNR